MARSRFLRFSSRSLLLGTLIVGLALGLLTYRARRQQRAVDHLADQGAEVLYDWMYRPNGRYDSSLLPPADNMLRRWLGVHYFDTVYSVGVEEHPLNDRDLESLASLSQLRVLQISYAGVDEDALARLTPLKHLNRLEAEGNCFSHKGMESLKAFPRLRLLFLGRSDISDAGLAPLASLQRLEWLLLEGNAVSGSGLHWVGQLERLEILELSNNPLDGAYLDELIGCTRLQQLLLDGAKVSDSQLAFLAQMKHLKRLDLSLTSVTDAGIGHLLAAPALKQVSLRGTSVSRQGVRTLEAHGIKVELTPDADP